jgi:hypothetical protein
MIAMDDLHSTADDAATEAPIDGFGLARAATIAGLVTVVFASFGPWLRSGQRSRTSYELFEVADRLDLFGDGVLRWAPRVWVCVPVLAAISLALFVGGIPKVAAAAAAVVGGFSLIVGWALQDAPLTAEWGSRIGVAGGLAALTGAIAVTATAQLTRPVQATERQRRSDHQGALRGPGTQ